MTRFKKEEKLQNPSKSADQEILQMFKNRMSDVKEIIKLSTEGKSSREIETKCRVGESYAVRVLKLGYEGMAEEIASSYGIKVPEGYISEEKSSQKSEVLVLEHEFLCIDCNKLLLSIAPIVYNGYTFRMYQCPKCKKGYPHPLDSQNYLYEENK